MAFKSKKPYLFLFFITSLLQSMTAEKKLEIMKKFAPVLRFDRKEKYFPGSVQKYLQQAVLQNACNIQGLPGDINECIDKEEYNNLDHFISCFDDQCQYGEKPNSDVIEAPCYAHLVEKINKDLVIQYIFFFPSKAAKPLQRKNKNVDWHYIDVHLLNKHKVEKVFLAHEDPFKGEMINQEDITFSCLTHPIVYVAAGSHALYSKPLRWNLENCAGDGARWFCAENLINTGLFSEPTRENEWIKFKGVWGSKNGPKTPTMQSWWREAGEQLYKIAKINISDHIPDIKTEPFDLKIPKRIRRLSWSIEIEDFVATLPNNLMPKFTLKHKGILNDSTLINNLTDGLETGIPLKTTNLILTGLLAREWQGRTICFNIYGKEE